MTTGRINQVTTVAGGLSGGRCPRRSGTPSAAARDPRPQRARRSGVPKSGHAPPHRPVTGFRGGDAKDRARHGHRPNRDPIPIQVSPPEFPRGSGGGELGSASQPGTHGEGQTRAALTKGAQLRGTTPKLVAKELVANGQKSRDPSTNGQAPQGARRDGSGPAVAGTRAIASPGQRGLTSR
jgi:hypothetical protein